ncbi:MAG: hypothetical protein KJZ84_24390 [Bryobacteraceae bacterium]|nr:hypothetical protein [Bryobacteraceae bacterium]
MAVLAAGCLAPGGQSAPRPSLDLNGAWQFQLDPNSQGEAARWHEGGVPLASTIQVPGVWQAQGIGAASGILRSHYVGRAWYKREVSIPADWAGKTVLLHVGGVVRQAAVFVNGQKVGEHEGFSTPFTVDVTSAVRPGAGNWIAFLVENPGQDVTESPDMQASPQVTGMFTYIGNWGGIHGKVHLEAAESSYIERVAITPQLASSQAVFRVHLRSRPGAASRAATVTVEAGQARASASLRLLAGDATETEILLPLPGARLWTPDDPFLYSATVRVQAEGLELDQFSTRFGMREITTRGNVLLLNGTPLYLRGFGDDNIEVLSGVAPASKQVHLERLRLARSFGFNAVRFHSMTPRQEYFEAADEAGILVMAELPVAYTMHFLPHKDKLRAELERILHAYRNHPSFLSLAFGNEFNLSWLKTEGERKEFLNTVADFYKLAKSIDPSRLILSNDGYVMRPTDMVSLFRDAPGDVPAVRHEFGNYYCSLPDPSLIPLFTGVLEPGWLHQKRAWIDASGLSGLYDRYLRNSWKLQQLGRKYQIENARRLPEFTGYHYWLIVDFPGGTGEGDSWEEGWFDYFWRPKGVTPEQGQELNSPVLLLIDADVNHRTFWADAPRRIQVSLSNYGDQEIRNGMISWRLLDSGRALASGQLNGVNAPLGAVSPAGAITLGPVPVPQARKLELVLEVKAGSATYSNRWNFWAFPRGRLLSQASLTVASQVRWSNLRRFYPFLTEFQSGDQPPAVLLTSTLDQAALATLGAGGRVWLMADRDNFNRSGDAHFFPASGGALGSLLPDHSALAAFPHEGFFDLQFYNLLEGAWNLSLDRWPKEIEPIAGAIRTTSSFLSKQKDLSRTGYIVEAKVGPGSLLVTSLDLRAHHDEAYPEAVSLFDSLLRYVTGPDFAPRVQLDKEQIDRLASR